MENNTFVYLSLIRQKTITVINWLSAMELTLPITINPNTSLYQKNVKHWEKITSTLAIRLMINFYGVL